MPGGRPLLAAASSRQLRPEEAAGETGHPTKNPGASLIQNLYCGVGENFQTDERKGAAIAMICPSAVHVMDR